MQYQRSSHSPYWQKEPTKPTTYFPIYKRPHPKRIHRLEPRYLGFIYKMLPVYYADRNLHEHRAPLCLFIPLYLEDIDPKSHPHFYNAWMQRKANLRKFRGFVLRLYILHETKWSNWPWEIERNLPTSESAIRTLEPFPSPIVHEGSRTPKCEARMPNQKGRTENSGVVPK